MELTNKKQVSITIKEFKTILPLLEDYFGIYQAVLSNVGFAIYKKSSQEIIPFQMHYLDSSDDEDLLCFFIFDDKKYSVPYPVLETKEGMTQENLILFIKTIWIIEYIYTATLEYNEASKNQSAEYREEMQNIIDNIDYSEYIRPDMLQLYDFINDWRKQPQNEKVVLKCGAKTLELNNHRNWIFTAINRYLDEHLKVSSVEQAKEELKTNYSTKTGRKVSNRYQSAVIYGVSCIFQKFTNSQSVSNQLCRFIRDYLKYLGMPITDDDFEDNDQLSLIKAKIYEFRKKGGAPNWLDNSEPEDLKRISFNYGW